MKLFYPSNHYSPFFRKEVFPLLKPFIKKEKITDAQRQALYGISDTDFGFIDTIDDAHVVILPMTWNFYTQQNRLDEAYDLVNQAKEKGKHVWSFNSGDYGVQLPAFDNVVVFRQGGYVNNNYSGHTGFPSIISDYVRENHLEHTLINATYGEQPIVGFCGQARSSWYIACKEMTKQGLRNLRSKMKFSNFEPQEIVATSFLRASLLNQLEAAHNVDCRFIQRKKYRAGITKNKETHKTTTEFYNNILESQYILCVRGAGNFSVRFYETLMMGRIPLYVHTDGYLPLSDEVDWKSHVVWVEYKDRHKIVESLLQFHQQLDKKSLVALFASNRKLWEEKLTLSGFFDYQKRKVLSSHINKLNYN